MTPNPGKNGFVRKRSSEENILQMIRQKLLELIQESLIKEGYNHDD